MCVTPHQATYYLAWVEISYYLAFAHLCSVVAEDAHRTDGDFLAHEFPKVLPRHGKDQGDPLLPAALDHVNHKVVYTT